MKIPLVDLKRQYQSIREEVDDAVLQVLESGDFILGENGSAFEKEFANYCGAKYGVGVGSGTDALTICLGALGVRDSEVITVPNTFIATVDGISRNGGKPVFVDVEDKTANIMVESVGAAITKGTRAVLPVHLYGNPVEMDRLKTVARENDLHIVEDAAQAHGAEYRNKRVGSFGDAACFSFYPTKDLGAYGDAGMILTNDMEFAEKCRMLRNYGQSKKYHHDFIGYNSRLDEIQAAVLRTKLHHLDDWIESRRRIARKYEDRLSGLNNVKMIAETKNGKCVYYSYVIRSRQRDQLQQWLRRDGISTLIHYPIPVHLQKAYKHLNIGAGSYPIAEGLSEEVLSLPMFAELTEDEVDYVCQSIESFEKQSA